MEQITWRKSSYSGSGGQCVEMAGLPGLAGPGAGSSPESLAMTVAVRDSKNPTGPVLTFTAAAWQAFVTGVKNGEFDLP